jgi:hypothetical protein
LIPVWRLTVVNRIVIGVSRVGIELTDVKEVSEGDCPSVPPRGTPSRVRDQLLDIGAAVSSSVTSQSR